MSWLVIGGALVVTGLLWWFFFGPKRAGQVSLEDGVQVVRVTVDGGYIPDVIEGHDDHYNAPEQVQRDNALIVFDCHFT